MFVNKYPTFELGRILKKEMLESIRDYPRAVIDSYFKEYSEGIISGVDIVAKDKYIEIKGGIIKHEGRIYILEEECTLPYYITEEEIIIKIRFIDKSLNENFIVYSSEIFFDTDNDIKKDELELGRFKLKRGSRLNTKYKNFRDFSAEYNTLNIINVKYSALEESTISPVILNYFLKEIRKSKDVDLYDITFFMECINKKIVNRRIILTYISDKLNIDYTTCSNYEIYKKLDNILKLN